MIAELKQRPWSLFGAGLGAGLLVGIGMMVGVLVAVQRGPAPSFSETLLHATSTHGKESLTIATGSISEGTEGIFLLDGLSGELQCQVLNPRTAGLGGIYRQNVLDDLGVDISKKPQFLMCTGTASLRGGGGGAQFAESLVYVADGNTGNWACYALPFNRSIAAAGGAQAYKMQLVGSGRIRGKKDED